MHLDVVDPAVARRRSSFCARSASRPRSGRTPRHAFDRGTRYQLHVAGDDRALQVLHEAGILTSPLTPLERPRGALSPGRAAGGVRARSPARGGSLSGPRSPHLEIRARESRAPTSLRASRTRKECASQSSTAGGTPSLREGNRNDRRHTCPCRRESDRVALRGARGHLGHALAGQSPGERRPREPGPHEQSCTRPAASRRATASERRVGEAARATSGDRRAPGATPDALSARACAQMQAPGHEGVSAQAFTEVTRARVQLTFTRGCRRA